MFKSWQDNVLIHTFLLEATEKHKYKKKVKETAQV